MGGIIEVRKRLGAGSISVDGNDVIGVEKNDALQKDYTVPNLPYVTNSSKVHFDGVQHLANVDWDDLSIAQKNAIMNNPDVQVIKKFGTP